MPATVLCLATMDTKGVEIAYVAQRLRAQGLRALTVDVGTRAPPVVAPDVARDRVLGGAAPPAGDRAQAIAAMSAALIRFLAAEHAAGALHGAIGIGGSGGTALLAPALRALPVGVPKLLVSTVASGDTAPYVDTSDLVLMPAVVDVAGLNRVSRRVLANAAHALAGMVLGEVPPSAERPCVGLTMFGVTTPCVDAARAALEERGYDPLVFHATGTGGRAMERLIAAGLIGGVLDLTTTEVADAVAGGVWPCDEGRFLAALRARIPCVLSLGACDMVNFGARATVPARHDGRRLHVHNAQVTLMRTSADECRAVARFIAARLDQADGPWTLLIPEGGLSALDAPGMPFHDPVADRALADELEALLAPGPGRRVVRRSEHINNTAFAAAAVAEFLALAR